MRVLVFIPAWNEEASIATVLADVREHLPQADVLVVDDGSRDRTAGRAREAGARVASLPINQGVGAAQQTGYMYALWEGYDVCAHLDGDGQHPARELRRLVDEVLAGRVDLVVGSRYRNPHLIEPDDYRPTISRRIGAHVFRRLVSLSTRQRFTDTTSGMRAMNRRAMGLFARSYSAESAEVESIQQAVLAGLRVEELPVRMLPRQEGHSFLTPLRSSYFIFKTLVVLLVGQFQSRDAQSGES